MGVLVYFSSPTGNTHRFVERLGFPAIRIPRSPAEPMPVINEPFVLITPTYADGQGRGAVHKQIIQFLNIPGNRALIQGVIATGNRNFGEYFGYAGKIISAKCHVPLLYRLELSGTQTDINHVTKGLEQLWHSWKTTDQTLKTGTR